MAMIVCPGCGEQISDKAKKCIHCGYILKEDSPKLCPECGAELEDGASICSKCGCPIEEAKPEAKDQIPQQVEVTKVNIASPINKKSIIMAMVALVVVVGIIFGVKKVQEDKAVQEAAKLSADYGENLKNISYLMLSGASDAEECGNLIKSVWSNAIYEKRDATTDKYTRPKGYFPDDFNVALGNLFGDSSFQSKIDNIESNQKSVTSAMKDMKNPPEEWEDAYDDLQTFYDSYLDLTNQVINPTGSLQTFADNFNTADTAVANAYSRMKLHFN
ncbi:zinc ribbon domain-containing protein [Oribacterium sp. WCC10]|uniref:zinc ribbon domain-containing protein n=1 Tax=Oribacterium sp. WCC10 TaxID=1855343 RepID=UPI0008E676F9|nr:zinc ribbon domain-containing protein [Oribacterium sp. WCC10]SFG57611.1 Double zinc ribbon [Oribacterium sp. WCC10]